MKIGGLTQFTLSDYPGKVAAIIFTQGCNFRCPFCHNNDLTPLMRPPEELIPEDTVMQFLNKRRGLLQGVVISGGEPTIQPGLPDFIRTIKSMGYYIKLDTNGSIPEVLRLLLNEKLLDYIAMDIKGPFESYHRLAGTPVFLEKIKNSIALIASSNVSHEFRTTLVEQLLSPEDIENIKALVPPGSAHHFQQFIAEYAFDPVLRKSKQ